MGLLSRGEKMLVGQPFISANVQPSPESRNRLKLVSPNKMGVLWLNNIAKVEDFISFKLLNSKIKDKALLNTEST